MSLNVSYASTIPAVFKIVEAVLNIITIALISVNGFPAVNAGAAGWTLFVSILTLIVSMFFYIIHLTNVIFRLSGPMTFIEFLCITICGVFQLTSMIVAAATANNRGTVIAAAVIYALNVVTYGVDSFFLFALYKVHGGYLNNPAVTQPQPKPMVPPEQPPMQQPAYPGPNYSNSAFDAENQQPYGQSEYANQ